jgi:hypothetical protein
LDLQELVARLRIHERLVVTRALLQLVQLVQRVQVLLQLVQALPVQLVQALPVQLVQVQLVQARLLVVVPLELEVHP